MYKLVAELRSQAWSGEIASRTFPTVEAAETVMARWARFGVDGSCDRPTAVRIVDEAGAEIRRWNWRRKQPAPPPALSAPSAGGVRPDPAAT